MIGLLTRLQRSETHIVYRDSRHQVHRECFGIDLGSPRLITDRVKHELNEVAARAGGKLREQLGKRLSDLVSVTLRGHARTLSGVIR